MSQTFPYQIVAFLDEYPEIDESAYNSRRGWFAHITLKRRFTVGSESETELIEKLHDFADETRVFEIRVGELIKPSRMPVSVLEIVNSEKLKELHHNLIVALGQNHVSRYPERDGANYLPHITAEYNGQFVIDVNMYKNKVYTINRICLLKDNEGDDAVALRYFDLTANA